MKSKRVTDRMSLWALMCFSWAAVAAQDVISPCPGGEGKGISATSRVSCVFGADVAAPRLLPPPKIHPSALPSHPCTPFKPCSPCQASQTLQSMPAQTSQQQGQVVFGDIRRGGELTQGGQNQGRCKIFIPMELSFLPTWLKSCCTWEASLKPSFWREAHVFFISGCRWID